jgi:hypothetical protein
MLEKKQEREGRNKRVELRFIVGIEGKNNRIEGLFIGNSREKGNKCWNRLR